MQLVFMAKARPYTAPATTQPTTGLAAGLALPRHRRLRSRHPPPPEPPTPAEQEARVSPCSPCFCQSDVLSGALVRQCSPGTQSELPHLIGVPSHGKK